MAKRTNDKKLPQNRQLRKKNPGNPHPLLPPVEHQFKPGVSGNPGGRPRLLSDAYREYLATPDPDTGRTRAQDIAVAQGVEALKGETGAAKELRQATEGDTLNLKNLTDAGLDKLISELERISNVGASAAGMGAPPESGATERNGAAGEAGDPTRT